jgi:predicted ATPase
MVTSLQIKNFKSIVNLSLDLGRFNVFIGENGCGKSNILEAIAFAGAASADKLDNEFLGNRGIRIADQQSVFSAFTNGIGKKAIEITCKTGDTPPDELRYLIYADRSNPHKWINDPKEFVEKVLPFVVKQGPLLVNPDPSWILEFTKEIEREPETKARFLNLFSQLDIKNGSLDQKDWNAISSFIGEFFLFNKHFHAVLSKFVMFTLEQSRIRSAAETTHLQPLGTKGEGLFQLLKKHVNSNKKSAFLDKVNENMSLLDWYEGFEFSDSGVKQDVSIKIRDKYLHPIMKQFDLRSTNEGFLYLLFYSVLFISNETPPFFAIDNIDASLNPKLCARLTRNLAELAGKHKKQVIVTTHNPAVLDGLDLSDKNQRLFVIRRNNLGHTIASRVEHKAERSKKLSEIWADGYIGGLPDNF